MSPPIPKPEEEHPSLPTVLIHRLPSFRYTLTSHLEPHFHLVDPLTTAAAATDSARALLCVGPTPVNEGTLNLYPSVRLVVGTSAGLDHVDLAACARRGVAVTSAANAFTEDVADFAVALLIDVLRRVSAGDRFVRRGLWPVQGDYPLGFKLGGKRVGILGLGNIGSEVAKRLVAFGCSVAYNSRSKKPSVPFPYYENAHDLAANSDALVVCCALNDQTRHVVNKDVMTALGKEGVIVNVGRGALIDEEELVRFLVAGELRGAGLDVFENEPNVPKQLFELDNVVLSPHKAVLTPESFRALQDVVFANLEAFFSNKPLVSPVECH
ncbi:hypothetical protein Tsubulata_002022 [Turnera subulata]|uniref:glyoxylate reductase (NADP(+)) n=1 Tax=Turnera subulata TaxID=218843 RepID=A0A9Q0FK69_9ROSI|nr:hypothetical protein Tsubulata_002022 [Turnera subulata]